MSDRTVGLTRYFDFYNDERPHQSLNYQTRDVVFASGEGGGAILDKCGSASVTAVVTSSATAGHGAPPPKNPALTEASRDHY